MQRAFDFGAATEVEWIRRLLRPAFGGSVVGEKLDPTSQLVRSLIGSRTRDPVSWLAFERLRSRYPAWADAAVAKPGEIEAVIAEVTFADVKARRLGEALRAVAAVHANLDLDFLGRWPPDHALAWLERLPGVGSKVAAATLNFSTLDRPAFVVDTHVLRVLRRFGFVAERADTRRAYAAVMAAAEHWSAADLAELHGLLKRLGQTICQAHEPNCLPCPLRHGCRMAARAPARTNGNRAVDRRQHLRTG
jgi:endonuclease III